MHISFQKISASLLKLLLVIRNSHRHEGFYCFSKCEEIEEEECEKAGLKFNVEKN